MLECLITFLVAVLIVVVVLWGLEAGLAALGVAIPANILTLIRIIAALILLLIAIRCLLSGTGILHVPL